jgi:hypothetical protein
MARQNFALYFGCRADAGVRADTQMNKNLADTILKGFEMDQATFQIQFPKVFENQKGSDVNFEAVASNTLQKLKLEYEVNVMDRKDAWIFVNSCIRDEEDVWVYHGSEQKCENAYRLFEEELDFDNVQVLEDLPKTEIIMKFAEIQKATDDWEAEQEDRELERKRINRRLKELKNEID